MSNSRAYIMDKISAKVDYYVQQKQPLIADVIANDICDDYAHEVTEDAEMHKICTFGYLKDNVIRFLTKHYNNPDKQADPNQRAFEGWEYLKTHYFVERDGERRCEHITELTESEMIEIEDRLDRKSKGYAKHRNEMRKYRLSVKNIVAA